MTTILTHDHTYTRPCLHMTILTHVQRGHPTYRCLNLSLPSYFDQVARITPLATSALPDPLALPPPPKSSRIDVSGACGAILPSSRMEEVHRLIQSEPVMVFGMLHSRCLSAASDRLQVYC